MRRFVSGLVILTAAACGGNTTAPALDAEATASVNAALSDGAVQLTLRYGQEQRVNGSVLRLSFDDVPSDSRCPIDAVCVWMGDAVARIGIAAAPGPAHPLELHTSLEPNSQLWNGVKVTLLELQPAPRASERTRPAAYSVKLQVERARR